MSKSDLNIRQRFRLAVKENIDLDASSDRYDSPRFQAKVSSVLLEFSLIQLISERISLFSSNESLSEVNTQYIPFAAIEYYRATLYLKSLADSKGRYLNDEEERHICKMQNLERAKALYIAYLQQIDSFGGVLNTEQRSRLESFDSENPELIYEPKDPAAKRALKIASFRAEKELGQKLSLLDEYYAKLDSGSLEEESNFDDEVVRQMFIDQLRLFALRSFSGLELAAMELQVLQQRASFLEKVKLREFEDKRIRSETDETGYTPNLEKDPRKETKFSDLLSKQGKILQPFVITSNKQDLRRKVFGTGQVLPSMSIEEYLDYELANGKMASAGDQDVGSEEEDDSDEELRKREWDDWKDANPKGSGNMKANLG